MVTAPEAWKALGKGLQCSYRRGTAVAWSLKEQWENPMSPTVGKEASPGTLTQSIMAETVPLPGKVLNQYQWAE